MTIAIIGSRGFVGTYLQKYFKGKNYKIITIKRAELHQKNTLHDKISQADIIINLSGANIIQRWSKTYKKLLYQSRIETTKAIVNAVNCSNKDQLLISTSAIGIYENDILCDEDNYNYAETFLAHICKNWEKEAKKAKARVVIFRLGVVLGDGGALQKMLLPFKMGLGGKIGTGEQPFSYIHIHDLARAYEQVIQNHKLKGCFNLCSPYPSTNAAFTKVLAHKLNRFAFLPLPIFVLKLIFGDGATVLSDGQKVYPKRLLQSGFVFDFETIEEVLDDLL